MIAWINIDREGQGEGDWIKLNARQYGLYRVNYPPELWDRLAEAATKSRPDAKGQEVPVVQGDDYAGLLDDAFALAQAGLTPISNFLNLTRYAICKFRIQAPQLSPVMPFLCSGGKVLDIS